MKKLNGTSEISLKNEYLQCFPSLAVHQQVICSYFMYKCSTIKTKQNKKIISAQNHSEVKRSTVWAHFNTEANSTRATFYASTRRPPPARLKMAQLTDTTYIHRCKELPLCSRPCHRVHSLQVIPQGSQKKITGAPFGILVAMQEMYPTKGICANMHFQAMKHRMKHTPKSHGVSLNIYHI